MYRSKNERQALKGDPASCLEGGSDPRPRIVCGSKEKMVDYILEDSTAEETPAILVILQCTMSSDEASW